MAACAIGLAIEQVHTVFCLRAKRLCVAFQMAVERAVVIAPLAGDESGERIADLDNRYVVRAVDGIERIDKHAPVCRDGAYALGNDRPCIVDPVVHRARNLIFFRVARHLEPRCQRKQCLRGKNAFETLRQPFLSR